jgi:hypothetical protein
MLDIYIVKAGTPMPGMRQRELVLGPWHCRLLHDTYDELDLLYFKAIYVKNNFIST